MYPNELKMRVLEWIDEHFDDPVDIAEAQMLFTFLQYAYDCGLGKTSIGKLRKGAKVEIIFPWPSQIRKERHEHRD